MSIVFAVGDALEFDSQFRGFQACVSDFPAGINFLNKKWDGAKGGRDEWIRYWAARARAARNACERGAYGLFWAMPRTTGWTQHALEDAGWEPVDTIVHAFAQGKPKGEGTMKPASEHWHLVRNGGSEPLQIDRCRVRRGTAEVGSYPTTFMLSHAAECSAAQHATSCECGASSLSAPTTTQPPSCPLCGSAREWACPAAAIDEQSGYTSSGFKTEEAAVAHQGKYSNQTLGRQVFHGGGYSGRGFADEGGASRFYPQFYYAAKSPSRERHAGCHDLFWEKDDDSMFGFRQVTRERYAALAPKQRSLGNVHPTPKAIGSRERPGIARWLVRLITPPGGRVCDVTCGSGSIPIAAHLEGFDAVGMDICPEAIVIAQHRAAYWEAERLSEARRMEARR